MTRSVTLFRRVSVAVLPLMVGVVYASSEWGEWHQIGNGPIDARIQCLEETQGSGRAQWNVELINNSPQKLGLSYTLADHRGTVKNGHLFLNGQQSVAVGNYFKFQCGAGNDIGIEITLD